MGKPRRGPKTRALMLATASKAKRAAELTAEGWTLGAIARELGYSSPSGVAMLLERHRLELPREALETLRDQQLARLETIQRMAMDDTQHKKTNVRNEAQLRVMKCAEAIARISGIVRAPPPVVVVQGEQKVDLSRLSIDELEAFQRIRAKLMEPAIVVQAEPPADP